MNTLPPTPSAASPFFTRRRLLQASLLMVPALSAALMPLGSALAGPPDIDLRLGPGYQVLGVERRGEVFVADVGFHTASARCRFELTSTDGEVWRAA